MEIKCEYCGSMIPETVEQCHYCGASNNSIKRTADGTPKTIAELANGTRTDIFHHMKSHDFL